MAPLLHHRPSWAGGMLCVALVTGCGQPVTTAPEAAQPSAAPSASSAATPTPAPPPTPTPTPASASAPIDGSPAVPAPAAQVAAAFVTALNTHNAQPGHDHGLHDANARTRPYVTDQVYAQIADPQTRNSASIWQQLTAASAITTVHIDKIALPEGAPPPTAKVVDVRITYTVTTTGQHLQAAQTLSQAMQVTLTPAGWRIDQLLAF